MKNGNTSSVWFRLRNVEKESVADRSSWIVAPWSTASSMWFALAVPGDFCPETLVPGQPSMVTIGAGLDSGLDLAVHSRHAARLPAQDRRAKGRTDRSDH